MQTTQLNTNRLSLVPFSEKFLTIDYVAWLNDPTIVRFSELRHRQHTLSSCRTYLESMLDSPHFFWAILLIQENYLHIGNITAHIDEANNLADVGILLGQKQNWGKGYGLEAWQAVCTFLKKDRALRKITAGCLSCNTSMINIMKKSGMEMDGLRKRHFIMDGSTVDVLHYCLFNE